MSDPELRERIIFLYEKGFNPRKIRWVLNIKMDDVRQTLRETNMSFEESSFEGPNCDNEETNKFKDLYYIRYYPNQPRCELKVLNLGDLGRIPKNSIWGNIDELRDCFEEYCWIAKNKPNRVEWTCYGSLLHYNNCDIYITKAVCIREAVDNFWKARGYSCPLKGEDDDNTT